MREKGNTYISFSIIHLRFIFSFVFKKILTVFYWTKNKKAFFASCFFIWSFACRSRAGHSASWCSSCHQEAVLLLLKVLGKKDLTIVFAIVSFSFFLFFSLARFEWGQKFFKYCYKFFKVEKRITQVWEELLEIYFTFLQVIAFYASKTWGLTFGATYPSSW